MKKLYYAVIAALAIALSGCAATQQEIAHDEKMYEKQAAAAAVIQSTPIFQLVALPGKDIEMKGVQSITVYNPTASKPAEFKPRKSGSEIFVDGLIGVTKTVGEVSLPFYGLWTGLIKEGINASKGAADKDVINKALEVATPKFGKE
jgi:hypothetical protein